MNLKEEEIKQRFESAKRALHTFDSFEEIDQEIDQEIRSSSEERSRYTAEFLANWLYCRRSYLPELEKLRV